MKTVAVFPLVLVRASREFVASGRYNWQLHIGDRLPVSVRHGVAVTCKPIQNVFCGVQAEFSANVFVDMGSRFNTGKTIYIGRDGSHNFPG